MLHLKYVTVSKYEYNMACNTAQPTQIPQRIGSEIKPELRFVDLVEKSSRFWNIPVDS